MASALGSAQPFKSSPREDALYKLKIIIEVAVNQERPHLTGFYLFRSQIQTLKPRIRLNLRTTHRMRWTSSMCFQAFRMRRRQRIKRRRIRKIQIPIPKMYHLSLTPVIPMTTREKPMAPTNARIIWKYRNSDIIRPTSN